MKPLIPFMSELHSRGHSITLFCAEDERNHSELKNEGLTDINVIKAGNKPPAINELMKDAGGFSNIISAGGPLGLLSAPLYPAITSYYEDKEHELPDVLVTDFFAPAALDAGDALGVPVVVVFPNPISMLGLPPPKDRSIMNHVQALFLANIGGYIFRRIVRKLRNNERKNRQLPSLKEQDIFPCLDQHRHIISLSAVGFEYDLKRSPLLHFVGPSPPANPAPLGENLSSWIEMQTKPIVYVAFGTDNTFTPEALANLTNQLVSLSDDVSILWSLPAAQQAYMPSEIKLPNTLRLENFVPQWSVLAHSNVKIFVTHNGSNSTYEGLLNKVPLVCCPTGKDQFANAARAKAAGVGVIVKNGAKGDVAKSVLDVFKDLSYYEDRLENLNTIFSKQGGAKTGSDVIEMVANTK